MQTRSLFLTLTVTMLGLTGPVLAQHASPSQSSELKAVFARLDKTAAAFRSAEASFEWDQYTKAVDETDKQQGKVYFRKVGGNVEMAAHVVGPTDTTKSIASSAAERYVLFSGGKVQLFQPSADHLDIYNAGKSSDAVESFLVLGFGGSSRDMLKSFDVTYGGHENIGGADTDRLELTPKSEKVKNMFNHIELWIDSRGISIQQKLMSGEGDYRLNKYSDITLNQKISDNVFKLKTTGKTTIETH
ncbi:MAG: LolA family protein [Terriglobales bacterium]